MRKGLTGFGLALAAAVALTPATASAETPPATCDLVQSWAIDPDCVSLTFTAQPPATTQSTQADIAWIAQIAEPVVQGAGVRATAVGDDWTAWRDKVCTLQGPGSATRDIPCQDVPNVTLTGLTPGSYVFTVTATTPQLGEEPVFDPASTDATVVPCDDSLTEIPGYATCYVVSGQVAWTVVAPDPAPAPPAPVVTPAPVAAAAPAATPQQCTSRRTLTMRIRERRGERIRSARITFRGRTIATTRRTSDGRLVARIDFRTLPAGRFSVQIRATLTNGQQRTYTRRYFTCEPKRPPSNNLESPRSL
jgi:hypothetical protein